MPNNETTFACHSPERMQESHDEDSLISFLALSFQSSPRPAPRMPSFVLPTSTSTPPYQSQLEILTAAVEITRESSREIEDHFQLTDKKAPLSHGPKQ
ncbi:unnamed protein product [Cylindrotheca closterium]|uniref:Uncharacterized protein n=1 Tax=Cylindrotheca closterium TaxID=2856 RepID=A0AAD2FY63_9STRA|nr:unnamed protein product [Cylindrotheca closterium]